MSIDFEQLNGFKKEYEDIFKERHPHLKGQLPDSTDNVSGDDTKKKNYQNNRQHVIM